ncbi:uncharacterized protein LOC130357560 [Hyla sarda]|uniref:uncharacterized protein LOC130357560 n=1 Tax=Hyla sarda TaxID=327740 RepID=UPI0024C34D77|nr:uncharacterized protein LOC130357560 [Hyla sarda]
MMQKPQFSFLVSPIFWLLIGSRCRQVHGETYVMPYNPNMFDDQYIGCSDTMEKDIMPKVLQQEMANKQFRDAWINATERWEDIRDDLELPEGFEDEYGIALLTFTNHYPKENPIYRQLNGNLTIAGASQRDYMEKFHFKALHFYLTRALQILKPNCHQNYTTYRGSKDKFQVTPVMKFGRFTSSSLNIMEALDFGTESFFRITTCFGARLGNLSFFPAEEEVLIPPTEKFLYVTKEKLVYYLTSTGETCSYFNCAYLEGEKKEVAVCRSDMTKSKEEPEDNKKRTMMSPAEIEERISALEDQISLSILYRIKHQKQIDDIESNLDDNHPLYDYVFNLEEQMEDLTTSVAPLLKSEEEKLTLLKNHGLLLVSLEAKMKKQQDLTGLIVPLHERESAILSAVLDHQESLTSLQEEIRDLRDLTSLIVPLRKRQNSIVKSILHHRKLLKKLQEELRELQGIVFGLMMFVVIICVLIICHFCRRFVTWM